jgi:nucleoside-triphosphatase THEP1
MNLLIVSGDKGEGKTTSVRKYAARMAETGRSVGGVVSPVIFDAGERIGYDLIDLRDGTRQTLARIAPPGEEPTVGLFLFG